MDIAGDKCLDELISVLLGESEGAVGRYLVIRKSEQKNAVLLIRLTNYLLLRDL